MHKLNIDINRLVEMYMSGKTTRAIADEVGASKAYVGKRLVAAGVKMRSRRAQIDAAAVVAEYVSGTSENAVAKKHGVSRTAIRRVLTESGTAIRDQSEAEHLKWQSMDKGQRSRQVAAANNAIRNKPPEFHKASSALQAQAKERSLTKVGHLEAEFQKAFEDRGFSVVPQKAVGPYNIDLAIGSTAVEVHATACNPHSHAYYSQRIVNLLKCGWHVIYIKTLGNVSVERAADEVSRMIHLVESNETCVSQYGMVRGSGQLVASGCLDGDEIAVVSASNGFFA